jgi:MFS superfamily sulfate permease-like transporter
MLTRVLPFLDWFRSYSSEKFKLDLVAGITVALVLIPQSMAYAQLAGLPAYYGLYASFLPPMIAALFGSSRQLATGPVAVVSLMTSASLAPLATMGSEAFVAYAILLALLVGAFQLLLGVLRLGLVVNFLSHPVVNGFTNAAAIIIATSQLANLLGVSVDNAEHHYETVTRAVQAAWHFAHWPTLFMGAGAFALMWVIRRINPRLPAVLAAVAVTTLISWAMGFQHDEKVDIRRIEAPEAVQAIERFNGFMAELPALAKDRTRLNTAIEEAQKKHDSVARLNLERDLRVVEYRIEELDTQAAQERARLRFMLFTGIQGADGRMTFRLKTDGGAKPEGGDDRTWRLKVGNTALDPQGMVLMGGGAVVGTIPKGLPAFAFPHIDLGVVLKLLPYAVIISILGFMEAISIAKAMAAKTGQRLDPNQELIGQGLANMLGALGRSYPVSGSFSRSAVNLQSGAITGLSSVVTSVMVVITLFLFTPLLYHLPQAVLAAVIMMAVISLINMSGFIHAWHAKWYDGAISVLSFIATLIFAPHLDKGIMIGVALSLGVFLYKSMRPRIRFLSRAPDEILRDARIHGLMECEYVDMVRFDGPLFFANASFLEDQITARLRERKNLKHLVLVADGINDLDASGEEALSLMIDRCRSRGVDVSLCGVNETVMDVLKRTHLIEKIGRDHIHPNTEAALHKVHDHAHAMGEEQRCPLTVVCQLV